MEPETGGPLGVPNSFDLPHAYREVAKRVFEMAARLTPHRVTPTARGAPPQCLPPEVTPLASKNHAAPPPWVPAIADATNHGRRCNDNRCRRCDDNRCYRRNYDRASIGSAETVWIAVKAGTAPICGAGAIEGHD